MCLLKLKTRVNGGLGCVSSRLGNCRSRYSVKSSLLLFQDCYSNNNGCYSNDCYSSDYNNCTIPDLFQFFYNQVLFHLLHAYCISITSLKFELPVTYNYAYDLSTQFILNQTKFIKNILKWLFMQNKTKMQEIYVVYFQSNLGLSLKVS